MDYTIREEGEVGIGKRQAPFPHVPYPEAHCGLCMFWRAVRVVRQERGPALEPPHVLLALYGFRLSLPFENMRRRSRASTIGVYNQGNQGGKRLWIIVRRRHFRYLNLSVKCPLLTRAPPRLPPVRTGRSPRRAA